MQLYSLNIPLNYIKAKMQYNCSIGEHTSEKFNREICKCSYTTKNTTWMYNSKYTIQLHNTATHIQNCIKLNLLFQWYNNDIQYNYSAVYIQQEYITLMC